MPSRNVAIQRDTYEALRREMRPGESFTKLFVRLLRERGAIDDVIGAWGHEDGASLLRRWRRIRGGR